MVAVLFQSVDVNLIRSAAKNTDGAAGPSGINAYGWRRLCPSFKNASVELCHSLALVARRLFTSYVDPQALAPLLACCLTALNKNPGVRPIGIGKFARHIIAKAILFILKSDIQEATGSTHAVMCRSDCWGRGCYTHNEGGF